MGVCPMRVHEVLTRIYLSHEAFDSAIAFYEQLSGVRCGLRFRYDAVRLVLAKVGCFLLIGGSPEDLAPFQETRLTIVVDDLDAFRCFLEGERANVLSPPRVVPTGRNMRVKHADGLVVEYVEHTRDLRAPS